MAQRISIKPEREYLREVVAKLQNGAYGIPAFQRDYVWGKSQVLDLFDSISKGYPIGSIILWKPMSDDVLPIKDVVTEEISDTKRAEYYILDGRQRTTTYYGCVNDIEGKPAVFDLYYDLDEDDFAYKSSGRKKHRMYRVCDLYDTLKMLGILQELMSSGDKSPDMEKKINRVKEINMILQSYEIGEMIIENCPLEDSSTVFSRINSKGTDISKVAMIQALTYKNKDSVLLSNEIDDIIASLSTYGFSNIKTDDILNCCYKYIGRNFYENQVMKSLLTANLKEFIPQLKVDIRRTVEFLNKRCGVVSYKLLPYNRQLIALASFFRKYQNPTVEQFREIEKWFFYTTYQQTFLNSSMGNVRSVFKRFDEFVDGTSTTAIDYEPVKIDRKLDFKFSSSSALSNFIVLCQVKIRRGLANEELDYIGEYRLKMNKPSYSFALLSTEDKRNIEAVLYGGIHSVDKRAYLLTDDMLDAIRDSNLSRFGQLRKDYIIQVTMDKLQSLGLEIERGRPAESNINELLVEVADLNNEESRELCSILMAGADATSAIFTVEKTGDESFTINYPSLSQPYSLSNESAKKCLKMIEDHYCNGIDAESFFGMMMSMEKDE